MDENRKHGPSEEDDPGISDRALGPGAGEGAERADDVARSCSIVESLLLVSEQPLAFEKIGQILGGAGREKVREVVAALREKYPADRSGILIEEVARGIQFRTNPANQEHVRRLFETKPARFSRPALETLAVVAYKQPVTRTEIEQIRGVDCAASLKTLMERRLVRVMGKKDVPGRPFLFGTTREFLEVFGLPSLADLPSMRDIEEFLAAGTGGAVPAPPAQKELFGEEVPPGGEGEELTAELAESEHGEPLASSPPEFPPGVSDDVLGEAAALGEWEAASAPAGDEARPGATVGEIRRRMRTAADADGPDESAGEEGADLARYLIGEETSEPLVTDFSDLRESVSEEALADAAGAGELVPPGEDAPGARSGGQKPGGAGGDG